MGGSGGWQNYSARQFFPHGPLRRFSTKILQQLPVLRNYGFIRGGESFFSAVGFGNIGAHVVLASLFFFFFRRETTPTGKNLGKTQPRQTLVEDRFQRDAGHGPKPPA